MRKLLSSTRFVLLGLCLQGPLLAAETFTIFSNEDKQIGEKSGKDIVGPLRFAAQDVESAIHIYYPDNPNTPEKETVVVHKPLSELTESFAGKRIVIAVKGDAKAEAAVASQGGIAPPPLETQAYHMQTTKDGTGDESYWIFGGDERGAMYGGLQLAENLQFEGFTQKQEGQVAPHIMSRGAKINVAFDYRLPSYAGRNDQKTPSIARGIEQIWKIEFWKTWLDEQARNRLNVLSVWSYNPFPALVNVPEFELSTLNDITGMGKALDHSDKDTVKNEDVPGVNPWQDKFLTLEKRQAFWREVMVYAKKRGFDFYFFNWNVCLSWVDNFYDVSVSHNEPLLADFINVTERGERNKRYLNNAIRELFSAYPDLTGFGVSPGDQTPEFPKGSTLAYTSDKICKWIFEAYSTGIAKACEEAAVSKNPNRKIGFIHRGLKVQVVDAVKYWQPVINKYKANLQFDHSMKYCMAYTYSTETPEWSFKEMMEMADAGQSTFLTLRNDGFYYSDFGDSTFVRNFLNNLPSRKYDGKDILPVDTISSKGKILGRPDLIGEERLRGFYFGHDTYTPTTSYLYADDALNIDPATDKPMYEIQRKWLSEMLWGRIGYDKNVSDVVFERGVAKRFKGLAKEDYPTLFSAWAKSSQVNTKLQELVMDQWHFDSFFYTEFCMYKDGGEDIFRTIQMFYKDIPGGKDAPSPAPGSKTQLASVKETGAGNPGKKPRTSWDVTKTLIDNGNNALNLLATIPPSTDKRFNALVDSIKSQAFLSLYYGYKVRGATFMAQGETLPANREKAKLEMKEAWGWWMLYTKAMTALYKPEDFRTYGLASFLDGWNHWNNAVKLEYTALGGNESDLKEPVVPKYPNVKTPVITSVNSANATVGVPFTYTITATNNPTSYDAVNLPDGLTINGAIISGTPKVDGFFPCTLSATNVAGPGLGAELTIRIAKASGPVVGTPPTITPKPMPDVTINQGATAGPLNFTVGDKETAAAALTVSARSSNTTLVPATGITLAGSGPSRTITLTPAANQSGTALITITVIDGDKNSTYTTFKLTVTSDGTGGPDPVPAPAPAESESKGGSCGLGGGLAFILFLLAGLRWVALARFQR